MMTHRTYFFVYRILCKTNNKSYIGVTNDPSRRFKEHRYDARRDSQYPIHVAIRKHGVQNFDFQVLFGSQDEHYIREEMEGYFINLYDTRKHGYNCTDGGEGIRGYGPEWIEKMRQAGKNISDETRQKRSEAAKKQHSDPTAKAKHKAAASKANQDPEKRKRIAEAAKARWANPEFRAKMQALYSTPEQKAKKSKAAQTRYAA